MKPDPTPTPPDWASAAVVHAQTDGLSRAQAVRAFLRVWPKRTRQPSPSTATALKLLEQGSLWPTIYPVAIAGWATMPERQRQLEAEALRRRVHGCLRQRRKRARKVTHTSRGDGVGLDPAGSSW